MKRKTKSGWTREFSRESEKMKVGKEKNEKKKSLLKKKNFDVRKRSEYDVECLVKYFYSEKYTIFEKGMNV